MIHCYRPKNRLPPLKAAELEASRAANDLLREKVLKQCRVAQGVTEYVLKLLPGNAEQPCLVRIRSASYA